MVRTQPRIEVGIVHQKEIRFEIISDGAGPQTVSYREGKIDYNGMLYDELDFEAVTISTLFAEPSFIIYREDGPERFAGTLKFIVDGGKVCAVNIIGAEDYLMSVVSTSGARDLKSKAIGTRQWLMAQVGLRHAHKAAMGGPGLDSTPSLVTWLEHRPLEEGKKAEQTGQSVRMTVPPKKESTTIALTADLESAYQNYTVNMSSEEAQKELFEAFVLQYLSMKKLQKLSNARIVDAEGNVIDGADVVNKLSNPSVIRSINLLLSQNPSLLNEWQAKALAETLGRELIQADHYVPIRRSELLRQISRAED